MTALATVDVPWRKSTRIVKSRVWDKIPEESTLIFGHTRIPNVRYAKGSLCAEDQLDPLGRFDTIPTCDRRPDGQTPRASIASRGKKRVLRLQVISLAGWVNIMYYIQDAHSFWDWIYFVALIIVSHFVQHIDD